MQEDILLDCVTPREALLFAAALKLNKSKEKIERRVNDLLKQVNIFNFSLDWKNVQILI